MEANTDDPLVLIEQAKTFVQEAKAKLEAGEMVDLAGLDTKVRSLCDVALSIPRADGQELRPALESLGEALTELRNNLLKAQTGVREKLDELTARSRATKAYQQSGATPPKSDEGDA